MREEGKISRRAIMTMGVIALAAGTAAVSLQDAAARPQPAVKAGRERSREPSVGEPGYDERVARLLGRED